MRKSLLLAFASLLFGVMLAEILLALLHPMQTHDRARRSNPPIYAASDTFPYRLKPGAAGPLVRDEFATTVKINSHGYRGEEFAIDKNGRFRILAIGDSFTFGWGSDDSETWPAVLQDLLRGMSGGSEEIEVINGGFAACYYPDTYYLYLKTQGMILQPDLVIIGFFIGNDVDHAALGENVWREVDDQGLPVAIGGNTTADADGYSTLRQQGRRYRYPVLRNSHLFQLASQVYRSLRLERGAGYNEWMYRAEYPPRTAEALASVERLLLATVEVASSQDVPILVAMFPAREQLRPEDYDFGSVGGDLDLDKPQRILGRFFEENGIDYVDLLPVFRERYAMDALYFPLDAHWTPRGNAAAAEVIADYLARSGVAAASEAGS